MNITKSKNIFLNKRQGGQAMIVSVVFFLFISIAIISGLVSPTVSGFKVSTDLIRSKQSFFLAESGVEDTFYRLKNSMTTASPEIIDLNGNTVTTTVVSTALDEITITGSGNVSSRTRNVAVKGSYSDTVMFPYTTHAGDGGIELQGSGTIVGGETFSNGPITGVGANVIDSNITSAGGDGLLLRIRATLSVWANTINQSVIKDFAYYQTIADTTVDDAPCPNPNCFPGSPDVADVPLSISDAQIAAWEDIAASLSTQVCSFGTYTISANITLGPTVIPCNLVINNNASVSLTGPIWVQGNITLGGTSSLSVDPSLGDVSVAVIADNPSDHISSSKISIGTQAIAVTAFVSNGGAGSAVFLISQHNGAEVGQPLGSNYDAITATYAFGGDVVLYASHGNITAGKSVVVRQISGYKITVSDASRVGFRLDTPFDPNFSSSNLVITGWAETQ